MPMAALTRGGWLAFFRTLAPPLPDSDADLLTRFAANRDEAALDSLVRRHAAMVFGICRRRFGETADAEDAFQSTFLVLAKNAGSLTRHTGLPGWLHRTATLTCLKLASKAHRRGTTPMLDEPLDTRAVSADLTAERHELQGVLDEELANLSEKLRSVFVLCCLEGCSSADVSALLGIPVGTVDSRLHAAREKLKNRLIRRGLAGAAITLSTATGVDASDELIRTTVKAALAFTAGNDLASPIVTTLAREVGCTMNAFPFKLIASAAMIATLVVGVGSGVYFAQAGGDPQTPTVKAKDDTKKTEEKPKNDKVTGTITKVPNDTPAPETYSFSTSSTHAMTQILLHKFPEGLTGRTISVGTIFSLLSKKYGIVVRAEEEYIKNSGIDNVLEKGITFQYEPSKLSIVDILEEVRSQTVRSTPSVGFRIKANQIIFGRTYAAFSQGLTGQPTIQGTREPEEILKDLHGPRVSLSANDQNLLEIVRYLRDETGANIVINAKDNTAIEKKYVTVILNNASVYTILKVVCDLYGLAPAFVDNVYYITDIKTAEKLNRETSLALFGNEKPTSIIVPVDREGRFIAPGPDGFRGQKIQLIPILVESEKPKPDAKPQVKPGETKP